MNHKGRPTSGADLIGDQSRVPEELSGTHLDAANGVSIRGSPTLVVPELNRLCLNPGSGTRLTHGLHGTANNSAAVPAKARKFSTRRQSEAVEPGRKKYRSKPLKYSRLSL